RAGGGERRAVGFATLARRLEGKMQDAARRLDRGEGPRMHLAEHGRAQRMRRQARVSSDCNIHGHARWVACGCFIGNRGSSLEMRARESRSDDRRATMPSYRNMHSKFR